MIPLFLALLLAGSIVGDVRKALNAGDLPGAERIVKQAQQQGITPESLEAYSWLARGALGAKKLPEADRYATETIKQVLARTSAAKLDEDRHLPIALGAAIEVKGQVLDATEGRGAAVSFLRSELNRYRATSIRTRIQKNINMLSLEGRRAPSLPGMALPRKPVLLFFWAHWCPDCKGMAATLAQLQREFPQMAIIAPTRLYGYVAQGREAGPAEEKIYISAVQKQFYSEVKDMRYPVSEDYFSDYGASTTPTVVLVDAAGIVRHYHPGRMTVDELRPLLAKLMPR